MKLIEIPFDEPTGSVVAQDYSGNNHHAELFGDVITQGRQGNSLYTTQSSFTRVDDNPIDFTGDFTVHFWLMNTREPYEPLVFYFGFDGLPDQLLKMLPNETPLSWMFFSIVKEGNKLKGYSKGSRNGGKLRFYDEFTIPPEYGEMNGFCAATDIPQNVDPKYSPQTGTYIDGFVAYNEAISYQELDQEIINQTTRVSYIIEGTDLKALGVQVEDARGLVGRPAMKSAKRYDWPDRHGVGINLKQVRYEVRTIELDCWFIAPNKDAAVDTIMEIKSKISGDNLKRFLFQAGSRYIPYDVYFPEEYDLEIPKWLDSRMPVKFTLVMVEPQPVKKILKFVRTGNDQKKVTMSFTANKELFSVYWGDGTWTHNVTGQSAVVEHTYQNDGEYYITVSGTVERMNFFQTNAVITWDKFF